jgi:hypothetical protein
LKKAAVGFRVHSGWAALVALAVNRGKPVVLARERVHLVEIFAYKFRQPYHTAGRLPPDQAAAFVARMKSEARRLGAAAIRKLEAELRAQGFALARCAVLLASGRPLPTLPRILASHALIHTADGELFREALLHAAGRRGLATVAIREREVLAAASKALRIKPNELARRIAALGRPIGPPWSQDEKLASALAWLALAPGRH